MAANESNSGFTSGAPAAAALDKAAAVGHSAVDRAIGAAVPAAQWIDQKAQTQQERYDATAEYVKANPLTALGIAFLAGILVGRILL